MSLQRARVRVRVCVCLWGGVCGGGVYVSVGVSVLSLQRAHVRRSNARRSPSITCNVSCAQAECEASHGRWVPQNLSVHPYECCGVRKSPLENGDVVLPRKR